MARWRCGLCGGKLSGGKCLLCGLDNSIYGRERMWQEEAARQEAREAGVSRTSRTYREAAAAKSSSTGKKQSGSGQHIRPQSGEYGKSGPYSGARSSAGSYAGSSHTGTARSVKQPAGGAAADKFNPVQASRKKRGGEKRGRITGSIVLIIVLLSFAPGVMNILESLNSDADTSDSIVDFSADDTYYDDSVFNDYQYIFEDADPYEYVQREIAAEGEARELLLGGGFYRTGVHIPEGVYRAELVAGNGEISVRDETNSIYMHIYFGEDEEYGEVTAQDDIRLYNGAELEISGGLIVRLITENAQPFAQETAENPLTQQTILAEGEYSAGDGGLPEGIYDISAKTGDDDGYGYTSVSLLYPNGYSAYMWIDGPDYAVTADGYTDTAMKNVVIPAGTEISVSYGDAVFTPGEGYYDVDYSEYE